MAVNGVEAVILDDLPILPLPRPVEVPSNISIGRYAPLLS